MVIQLLLFFCISQAKEDFRIEEQRKYNFPKANGLTQKTQDIGPFTFFVHSIYATKDIYFDSADKLIQKNGLSLRFRQVTKPPAKPAYIFQVKSEMEKPGELRMEEEVNLERHSQNGQPISFWMDQIIAQLPSKDEGARALVQWLTSKKKSYLPPFQALRRRQIFDFASLQPVFLGSSERQRFHVLVDRLKRPTPLIQVAHSEKKDQFIPAVFVQHPEWEWLMEASSDKSLFKPYLQPDAVFEINELEIENKYRPREVGTALMNELEKHLNLQLQAVPGLKSKFLQAAEHFESRL